MILTLEIPQGCVGAVGVRAYLDGFFVEKVGCIEPMDMYRLEKVADNKYEIKGEFRVVRDGRGIGTIKCK